MYNYYSSGKNASPFDGEFSNHEQTVYSLITEFFAIVDSATPSELMQSGT